MWGVFASPRSTRSSGSRNGGGVVYPSSSPSCLHRPALLRGGQTAHCSRVLTAHGTGDHREAWEKRLWGAGKQIEGTLRFRTWGRIRNGWALVEGGS